jgi:hypothetical protein
VLRLEASIRSSSTSFESQLAMLSKLCASKQPIGEHFVEQIDSQIERLAASLKERTAGGGQVRARTPRPIAPPPPP